MRCRWRHVFMQEVPADESPEMTEGYEGFYHRRA